MVFGDVKAELGSIESCSSRFKFLSGSNLSKIDSSTPFLLTSSTLILMLIDHQFPANDLIL